MEKTLYLYRVTHPEHGQAQVEAIAMRPGRREGLPAICPRGWRHAVTKEKQKSYRR